MLRDAWMPANMELQLLFTLNRFGTAAVTKDDVEEIIQKHIVNNQPVKRLMIKDKKFNKDANHH